MSHPLGFLPGLPPAWQRILHPVRKLKTGIFAQNFLKGKWMRIYNYAILLRNNEDAVRVENEVEESDEEEKVLWCGTPYKITEKTNWD